MALSETGHHRLICNQGCEVAYSVCVAVHVRRDSEWNKNNVIRLEANPF